MSDNEPLTDADIELLRTLIEKCGEENVLISIQDIILEKDEDEDLDDR